MRLAGLGHFYRWPLSDLVGLTAPEVAFWEDAAVRFLEQARAHNEI